MQFAALILRMMDSGQTCSCERGRILAKVLVVCGNLPLVGPALPNSKEPCEMANRRLGNEAEVKAEVKAEVECLDGPR